MHFHEPDAAGFFERTASHSDWSDVRKVRGTCVTYKKEMLILSRLCYFK